MALMYPRTLDLEEVKSKAEALVFDRLRDQLPDEWECFHSASWTIKEKTKGARDSEIDFVIAHPDKGILCLEVKGGGLECRHGAWYRIEDGKPKRMKSPFKQAADHRYDLARKIKKVSGWKDHELFLVQAVCFPDITVHKLVLGPDAPAEIVIDRKGVESMERSIEDVLRYHGGKDDKREPPGAKGMKMLRDLLAPSIRIEVPMATQFRDEEEEMIILTQRQAELLSRMQRRRRLAVHGCAGSGKTMLGVERAKRVAAKGKDVAFICFNKALREHLREREKASGVHFHTFHGLCTHLAYRAGIELPDFGGENPPPGYWAEDLPLALVEACDADHLGPQFDALFVDEAQDLRNSWFEALLETLRDPKRAQIWLFLDDNQRVYDSAFEVPDDFLPFDLDTNCRNTQKIGAEVLKKYEGEIIPAIAGPVGRDPELHMATDQAKVVTEVIERLCGKEEIPPQDVVVLSSHGIDKSTVAREAGGRYELTKDFKPLGKYVRFSSIRAFKGLESPVVILCELEDLDEETMDQQLYVGISRAKNHCVVVAPG